MKTLFTLSKIAVISLLTFATAAFASEDSMYTPRGNVFERAVADYKTHSKNPSVSQYRVEQQKNLSSASLEKLLAIATQQAQIWGDTILEGDYFAEGNTVLDSVEGVFKNNQLIAYKIIYSEKAWDTSNCRFNSFTRAGLESCQAGRIREMGYVSPDFKNAFTDLHNLAEFVAY